MIVVVAGDVCDWLEARGLPVTQVSIGTPEDRATWRATVRDDATKEQRAAVDAALATVTEAEIAAARKGRQAVGEIDATALKAIVLEIYPYLTASKPSLPQLRQNIIDRYKALNGR